jgi:uncharacterized protein YecE (DUF72 family)
LVLVKIMKGKIFIGTSGWNYKESKGIFYPENLRAADYLTYNSKVFNATEINTSFYHMPRMATVKGWMDKVSPEFKFCPKISKYITHIKRLKEPEEPLSRFFEVFEQMQPVMGPVLIQLPPSLKFEYDIAGHFYKELKKHYRNYDFAMEVRHKTWLDTDSIALLTKYKIALVVSQSGIGFPYAEIPTGKNIYLRFHGPEKLYASGYSDEVLREYANKLIGWEKEGHLVWAFFNNGWAYAVKNALTLKSMVAG